MIFAGRHDLIIRPVIWADREPLEGKDCSVLNGSKLKSKLCESEEHFLCVGENFKENI